MSDFGKLRSSSPNALKSVDESNLRIGSARIRYRGNRRAFGLETPNQAAAAAKAKEIFFASAGRYNTRKAAYDLRKFCGKKLVHRIANSRRYRLQRPGI